MRDEDVSPNFKEGKGGNFHVLNKEFSILWRTIEKV